MVCNLGNEGEKLHFIRDYISLYLPPEGGGGREIEKGDYHGFQGNGGNQSMLRKGRGGH